MEKYQRLCATLTRQLYTLGPGRMPPATPRGRQLLGCKLGIVDKNVRPGGQL